MDYIDVAQCFGIFKRRTQALLVESCSDLKLTYSEFILLLKLYDNEGCIQDDISEMLYLDKAVVTRVVKSLEEKKLIHRKQDKVDHRKKRVFLTKKGQNLQPKIMDRVDKLMDFMADGMKKNEMESMLTSFSNISQKLSKCLYEDVYGEREV